jgi:hypothetical protein
MYLHTYVDVSSPCGYYKNRGLCQAMAHVTIDYSSYGKGLSTQRLNIWGRREKLRVFPVQRTASLFITPVHNMARSVRRAEQAAFTTKFKSVYRISVLEGKPAKTSISSFTGRWSAVKLKVLCTGSFTGVKRPGCGADHPSPASAEVENEWSYPLLGPWWPVTGWP